MFCLSLVVVVGRIIVILLQPVTLVAVAVVVLFMV
jgi:hypothetical protein